MTFRTSVHLVTYNGAPWLPFCLQSLLEQTDQDYFLLVIDNASLDGSARLVEEFLGRHPQLGHRARLVRNKQNLGFARGHNQAFTWTESEFVLVLNQDTFLTPTYLSELAQCLTNEERVAAVTGKLKVWDFDPATFHGSALGGAGEHIDSVGLAVRRSRQVLNLGQGEVDRGQYDHLSRVFGVPATAPLYRRSALLAVSPDGRIFDEDFVSYKEDVDLAWRLVLADYDAWVAPSAVAYHDRSLSSGVGLKSELRQRQGRPRDLRVYSWVNHLAVLIKNERGVNFMKDLPWVLGHELAKAMFLLFTDPLTLLQGKLRLWRLLPKFLSKRAALKPTRRRHAPELRHWWKSKKVEYRI